MVLKDADDGKARNTVPSGEPVFGILDTRGAEAPPVRVAALHDVPIVEAQLQPETRQEAYQKFVDGFGPLGYLYGNSIKDERRFNTFQDRMTTLFNTDRDSFDAMADLGLRIRDGNPTPAQIGKELADVMVSRVQRENAAGGAVDLNSPELQLLRGAMAGVMLGARFKFDQSPQQYETQTRQMIDAFDAQLQARRFPPYLSAVIYGDNREPAIATVRPGAKIDRYNYAD